MTVLEADAAWERMWAPYSADVYERVLEQIARDDIVLDIGAGDLRLSRQMAGRALQVWAIEQRQELVAKEIPGLPQNCVVIRGDARTVAFPAEITVAVLLMRHCRHVALYWDKLLQTACGRLITNARWRLGVEIIDLNAPRIPFRSLGIGWFACRCGHHGFVPGPASALTGEVAERIWEVFDCPMCFSTR
jgi:hypothetical protein